MDFDTYLSNYYMYKLLTDKEYSYEQAIIEVKNKLYEKFNNKILHFNRNIEYTYDKNNIPKIIHFTCKDKHNINNEIWINCLNEYKKLYPDYNLIIYDNNDIFNIIEYFDKKKLPILKSIQKGAVLADVFRYLILYLRGGYYSDMDCFPMKRIERLSDIQYHGNNNNNFYIYPKKNKLPNSEWDFHENPCTNCKMEMSKIDKNSVLKTYKCFGHKYINENTSIIVGYEFEKTWHNEMINGQQKHLWTDKGIGICQWFIGAKPQEKLFIKCYKKSILNVQKFNHDDKSNYHYNVINSTGPLFFTKMINQFNLSDQNFKDKICVLPCDYFCCGSFCKVPATKNMFVQHKFTGTWLK